MSLATYWDIGLVTGTATRALYEEFSGVFYPAFLREAQASVPGRVGGLYDIFETITTLAPIILRPVSTADDPAMHQVFIVHDVLDWIVEGQATTDPEVLVPLTLALNRHLRRARELADGLATHA